MPSDTAAGRVVFKYAMTQPVENAASVQDVPRESTDGVAKPATAARRLAWCWFVALAVLLVAGTVAAIVVATLTGHYEPIIGAGITLVLFGPILWGLTR